MRAAVLTVSDRVSRGEAEDRSGALLDELLRADGFEVERRVVADERDHIAAAIRELAAQARVVLTTGGTGVAPRDVTPEATRDVIEREVPGIAEALRADALQHTPHAPALARRRRPDRLDARRQPPRLARRVPRRLRSAAAGARPCDRAPRGRAQRDAPADVTDAALAPLPARFARLVKIEHTIFALPFAYVGAFLAVGGRPSTHDLLWITLAMVGARSLAMALNRLIDAGIDARNPRTAGRELPSGQLSAVQVALFCLSSLALFLVAVWQLAPLTHELWPIPVAGFVVYPYLKRWTWLCHFWLGAVDGLAPVGAWVAITNRLPWQAWLLGAAVALWVAGFDLFYALFDAEVDRAQGLHSIATRFGVGGAFAGARLAHAATVACLVGAGLGCPSARSTGSASPPSARCSCTSTCSSGRTTCAGSTPRSSR